MRQNSARELPDDDDDDDDDDNDHDEHNAEDDDDDDHYHHDHLNLVPQVSSALTRRTVPTTDTTTIKSGRCSQLQVATNFLRGKLSCSKNSFDWAKTLDFGLETCTWMPRYELG